MGADNEDNERHSRRIHNFVPESAAVNELLDPSDRLQHVWHQQPGVCQGGGGDAFQAVPRVWVLAVPPVLPQPVVHGGARCGLRHHHYHGHRHTLCQEQEL